jgi:transcriptional regulator of NAD metabolism
MFKEGNAFSDYLKKEKTINHAESLMCNLQTSQKYYRPLDHVESEIFFSNYIIIYRTIGPCREFDLKYSDIPKMYTTIGPCRK